MGTASKAKDKAKSKIAKLKEKLARKAAVKRACVALIGVLLLQGCATSDNAQPAKSQTQNNTFDDCIIIVAANATVSNGAYRVEGGAVPPLELFTQTQSLESSGTESFAQSATQTPTTDVKPDIDVHYNDAVKNASDASKGVLETLASALVAPSASASAAPAAETAASGSASPASAGTCANCTVK